MHPSVLWVWSQDRADAGRPIRVVPTPGYDGLASKYQSIVDDALAGGTSPQETWDYWSANGGNGYTTARSASEVVQGDTIDRMAQSQLKQMLGASS
jgi:hypothetical protein